MQKDLKASLFKSTTIKYKQDNYFTLGMDRGTKGSHIMKSKQTIENPIKKEEEEDEGTPARSETVKSWANVLQGIKTDSEPDQSKDIIMKLRMVKEYKSKKNKELIAFMLKLQLVVEEAILPLMKDHLEWNEKLFELSEKEFARKKEEIKKE